MRLAGPTPGAIDQNARRAVLAARFRHRRHRLLGVGDVAAHREAADLGGDRAGAVEIDVEAGHLGAGAGELDGGRGAQARAAAGDDRRMSLDVHGQFVPGSVAGVGVLDQQRDALAAADAGRGDAVAQA